MVHTLYYYLLGVYAFSDVVSPRTPKTKPSSIPKDHHTQGKFEFEKAELSICYRSPLDHTADTQTMLLNTTQLTAIRNSYLFLFNKLQMFVVQKVSSKWAKFQLVQDQFLGDSLCLFGHRPTWVFLTGWQSQHTTHRAEVKQQMESKEIRRKATPYHRQQNVRSPQHAPPHRQTDVQTPCADVLRTGSSQC